MARMPHFAFPVRSILIFGTVIAVLVGLNASPATAQRPAAHVVPPPHAPVAGHPAIPRFLPPPVFHTPAFSPRPINTRGEPNLGLRTGPFFFRERRRFFFAEPIFGFGAQFWLQPYWLTNCGAMLTWESGCYGLPAFSDSYGTYLVPQTYQVPVYVYGSERHDEVQLLMKDGTIYNVSDYWFVNGQVHLTLLQELPDGGYKNAELVVSEAELDLPATVDVNTRRGFRMVKRNEPWRKYLQDHPDDTPPALAPPQAK